MFFQGKPARHEITILLFLKMNLPIAIDPDYFDEVYRLESSLWISAVEELCYKHQINAGEYSFFKAGSNLIAAVNDAVIVKIFPPFHRHQWVSEYKSLAFFHSKLPVSIPDLLAVGERDDQWTYVIISRLKGQTLDEHWSGFEFGTKRKLMEQIGAIMKSAHAIAPDHTILLEPDWKIFLHKQFQGCYSRHLKQGMPSWFMNQLEDYLNRHFQLIPSDFTPVLLTGEYTPFNFLVNDVNEEWNYSGMIDFGDAMIGFQEYDLLGPILFLAGGDGELIKALIESYGYDYSRDYPALRHRLMVLALLHRYSNFDFQIKIDSWKTNVKSFKEMEDLVFPFV